MKLLLRSNFSHFPQYFQHIFSTKGVKLHVRSWNLVVRLVFSSVLHIWYVEVWISRSISDGPFDFEITRVDCICLVNCKILIKFVSSYSSSFRIQPPLDTPLTWVTIVCLKSSAELAPLFKRLSDLFIGAERWFFSQTNQFPSIDHVLCRVWEFFNR